MAEKAFLKNNISITDRDEHERKVELAKGPAERERERQDKEHMRLNEKPGERREVRVRRN